MTTKIVIGTGLAFGIVFLAAAIALGFSLHGFDITSLTLN